MHNIEKSGFRKGEYVGYGGGTVWKIVKGGAGWRATPRDYQLHPSVTRATLKEISTAIEKMPTKNPAKKSVYRPSQITKKKPDSRLLARRKKQAKRPVRGYFPNPLKYKVQIAQKSGTFKTVGTFDKLENAKAFAQSLAKHQRALWAIVRVWVD